MFGSRWPWLPRARIAIDLGSSESRFDVSLRPSPAKRPAADGGEDGPPAPAVRRGTLLERVHANRIVGPVIRAARRVGAPKPRVLASLPSSTPEFTRAALADLCFDAGAGSVLFTSDPVAAAIGVGAEIGSRHARLVLDVGEGITDLAVLREGRIVTAETLPAALQDMRLSIRTALGRKHRAVLNDAAAAELLRTLRSPSSAEKAEALARDLHAPLREVSPEDVAAALAPTVDEIAGAVLGAVRRLEPETACEVIENGVVLVGGGAASSWLVETLGARTGIAVVPAFEPLAAVIRGASRLLEAFESEIGVRSSLLERWTSGSLRRPAALSPFDHAEGPPLPAS